MYQYENRKVGNNELDKMRREIYNFDINSNYTETNKRSIIRYLYANHYRSIPIKEISLIELPDISRALYELLLDMKSRQMNGEQLYMMTTKYTRNSPEYNSSNTSIEMHTERVISGKVNTVHTLNEARGYLGLDSCNDQFEKYYRTKFMSKLISTHWHKETHRHNIPTCYTFIDATNHRGCDLENAKGDIARQMQFHHHSIIAMNGLMTEKLRQITEKATDDDGKKYLRFGAHGFEEIKYTHIIPCKPEQLLYASKSYLRYYKHLQFGKK